MADSREPQFFARNIVYSVGSAGTVLTILPHAGCEAGNGHATASALLSILPLKKVTPVAA